MDIEYRRRDRHIKINQLIVRLAYMEGGRPAPRNQVCMYVAVVVVVCGGTVLGHVSISLMSVPTISHDYMASVFRRYPGEPA